MKIHWLASYPKSGNTWVRFLLYHYLYGELTESAALGRRIPDVLKDPLPVAGEGPMLVKTHWVLSPKMPHVERTAGAIYVVRHPRDVVLSLINFYRLRDPEAPWTDEFMARNFIQGGGDPSIAKMGFGTWVENVSTWLIQRRFPMLLVRYEDLKADAPKELRRMIEFLGEPVDAARLARAVELSSFDRMRELEVKEKQSGNRGSLFDGGKAELDRGLLFMSKGRSGQSLSSIAPTLDEEFDRRFKVPMWLTGY